MARRLKIGVDCDGPLADTIVDFIEFHNANFEPHISADSWISYYMRDNYGITIEEEFYRFEQFYLTDKFQDITPTPGAREIVPILASAHELILNTARGPEMEEMTRAWLERHFPGCFRAFSFGHVTEDGQEHTKVNKYESCLAYQMDVMIDDAMHHAIDCAPHVGLLLLWDAPWNRGETPDSIIRVRSWEEVLEEIDRFNKTVS